MKETAPGWPDPTEWVKRLDAASRDRAELYLSLTAKRNGEPGSYVGAEEFSVEAACTLQASRVLSSVAAALDELPTFVKHPATTVLNDLVIALHDLAMGGAPSLLSRGERRDDFGPVEHLTVVGYAALSVRLLKKGYGYTDAAARTEVAKRFGRHGMRGRKGGTLSPSTLQDWQDKFDSLTADHPVRTSMDRLWDKWTMNPDWQHGRDIAKALAWIDKLAESPGLQNKGVATQG